MKMNTPADGQGLDWIAAHDLEQLHLIDGVHTASMLAASLGSLPALQHLLTRVHANAAMLMRVHACDTHALYDAFNDRVHRFEHEGRRIYTARLMCQVAKQGQLAALTWLQVLCYPSLLPSDNGPMKAAAERGNLSMMRALQQGPFPAPCQWPVALAAVPHLDCLEWLQARADRIRWGIKVESILFDLASSGCLDILIRLHQHSGLAVEEYAGYAMVRAAEHGHLSMVQWFWELRSSHPQPWPPGLCYAAAKSGSLQLLKWSCAQQPACPLTEECTAVAAAQGNLPMLQWLRAQDPPCAWSSFPRLYEEAASSGNVKLFQWLQMQDALRPDHRICTEAAAKHGHLPMLKYLHSLDSNLDGMLYYHAAVRNSGHILQWLHRQLVPVLSEELACSISDQWIVAPAVMFLGDIGFPLCKELTWRLVIAQRTYCTFHGLVRWSRTAVADPSKGIHCAFNPSPSKADGEHLLIRLSMLPEDLLHNIARLAGLQHDLL